MKTKNITKLIFSIIICQLAGIIGSIFTYPAVKGWYATLQRPFFSPPNWVFGPVWILLYILMGISLYLVWKKGLKNKNVKTGLYLFGFQLVLNAIWSLLFFGLKNPFYAFLEIIILWFAIALTIYQFWKINKKASYLLIPYIAWVTFAAILNFYIWRMNI